MSALSKLLGHASVFGDIERGEPAEIPVYEVPVSQVEKYFESYVGYVESNLVAFYTRTDAGFADTLSHATVLAILEKGDELNSPFLSGWKERVEKRIRKVYPKLPAASDPPKSPSEDQPLTQSEQPEKQS
jgi:hypothetical protein